MVHVFNDILIVSSGSTRKHDLSNYYLIKQRTEKGLNYSLSKEATVWPGGLDCHPSNMSGNSFNPFQQKVSALSKNDIILHISYLKM